MRTLFTALIFITRICLHAQEPVAQPLIRRTPPPNSSPVPKAAPKAAVLPVKAAKAPDIKIELFAAPPALDKSIIEAIRVGESVRSEPAIPMRGQYGSLVYTYGQGEPVLVCAPLRVCFVELQPGEKLLGEPYIGDSVRWFVSPGLYGGEDESTQVVVVKAQDPNLETNLLLMTNRRMYSIRLVSRPSDYVARVAFRYPEDERREWLMKMQAKLPPPPAPEPKVLPAIVSAEQLNFGYKVKGGNEHLRPLKVFDDGSKTYLAMPATMQHREAPALLVIGDDGRPVMSNYRVIPESGTYVLDRLADRIHLVVGAGKKAKRVEITRANKG
jgi:type IV secretion system protein VirB9